MPLYDFKCPHCGHEFEDLVWWRPSGPEPTKEERGASSYGIMMGIMGEPDKTITIYDNGPGTTECPKCKKEVTEENIHKCPAPGLVREKIHIDHTNNAYLARKDRKVC